MSAAAKHRDAIVQSAIELFRKQGYAGTGLNEILEASGAPKGSLYYYFPNGKISIGVEAIHHAGSKVAATLEALAKHTKSPSDLVKQYCDRLAGWMKSSGYQDGCPITTTLLELASAQEEIRAAGLAAFDSWAGIIEQALVHSKVEQGRARRLSTVAIAAISGALVQARVQKSGKPLLDAGAELEMLFTGPARITGDVAFAHRCQSANRPAAWVTRRDKHSGAVLIVRLSVPLLPFGLAMPNGREGSETLSPRSGDEPYKSHVPDYF